MARVRLFSVALVLSLALGALSGGVSPAAARRTGDVAYRWEQVWTTAVRLVRVDYGFDVIERDPDIGFVMFEYEEAGSRHHGAIELVRVTDRLGRARVRVVVSIPTQPQYVERMMMDRLERKLRAEIGAPPVEVPAPVVEPESSEGDAATGEAAAEGAAPEGA